MPDEKYIVAAADNPSQIAIRNILSPYGFIYLANCSDPVSLLRLVRTHEPDFVVIDFAGRLKEYAGIIETIDEEQLCPVVVLTSRKEFEENFNAGKFNYIAYCPKQQSRELLSHTAELAVLYYIRMINLKDKLKKMTENYETRKLVERAKWILMERDGISETEAYERIRKKSMDSRMSMKEIAEALIFTSEMIRK